MSADAKKINVVCPCCGSKNILKDAYATWNTDAQDWELHSTYDDIVCEDCGEHSKCADEVEIEE